MDYGDQCGLGLKATSVFIDAAEYFADALRRYPWLRTRWLCSYIGDGCHFSPCGRAETKNMRQDGIPWTYSVTMPVRGSPANALPMKRENYPHSLLFFRCKH